MSNQYVYEKAGEKPKELFLLLVDYNRISTGVMNDLDLLDSEDREKVMEIIIDFHEESDVHIHGTESWDKILAILHNPKNGIMYDRNDIDTIVEAIDYFSEIIVKLMDFYKRS